MLNRKTTKNNETNIDEKKSGTEVTFLVLYVSISNSSYTLCCLIHANDLSLPPEKASSEVRCGVGVSAMLVRASVECLDKGSGRPRSLIGWDRPDDEVTDGSPLVWMRERERENVEMGHIAYESKY